MCLVRSVGGDGGVGNKDDDDSKGLKISPSHPLRSVGLRDSTSGEPENGEVGSKATGLAQADPLKGARHCSTAQPRGGEAIPRRTKATSAK